MTDRRPLVTEPRDWAQFVFGKLVERERGTTLPRYEHGRTGKSVGFPVALEGVCHPSQIGLGCDVRWEEYPWSAEGGGIVVVPYRADGQWFVVAGRIRGRSEAGEGVPGRYYTQAHYL